MWVSKWAKEKRRWLDIFRVRGERERESEKGEKERWRKSEIIKVTVSHDVCMVSFFMIDAREVLRDANKYTHSLAHWHSRTRHTNHAIFATLLSYYHDLFSVSSMRNNNNNTVQHSIGLSDSARLCAVFMFLFPSFSVLCMLASLVSVCPLPLSLSLSGLRRVPFSFSSSLSLEMFKMPKSFVSLLFLPAFILSLIFFNFRRWYEIKFAHTHTPTTQTFLHTYSCIWKMWWRLPTMLFLYFSPPLSLSLSLARSLALSLWVRVWV